MNSLSEETDKSIYGEVFTDSIGEKGSKGDSYYKMMKHNIKTIHGKDGIECIHSCSKSMEIILLLKLPVNEF